MDMRRINARNCPVYLLALEQIAHNRIPPPQVFEEEVDQQESAWMTVLMPPRERGAKWWQFWR